MYCLLFVHHPPSHHIIIHPEDQRKTHPRSQSSRFPPFAQPSGKEMHHSYCLSKTNINTHTHPRTQACTHTFSDNITSFSLKQPPLTLSRLQALFLGFQNYYMTQAGPISMFPSPGDREKTEAGSRMLLGWCSWRKKSLPSGVWARKM